MQPERILVNNELNAADRFGVCNYPGISDNFALMQSKMAELKSSNLGWTRTDFHWSSLEPTTKGVFDWTKSDNIVNAANGAGMKLLPILCYSVNWANGLANDTKVPPLISQDYADYCAAVVNRYYPQGVTHYELWNEPNIRAFWKPDVGPAKYYEMMKLAYTAIKAVQPNAQVLFGALTLSSLAENDGNHVSANLFLQGAYDAGCKNFFDIFNYHPYEWFNYSGSHIGARNVVNTLRQMMVANGDGHKKIWFTEYGRPTGGSVGNGTSSYSTEDQQREMYIAAIREIRRSPYIDKMFFYNFQDIIGLQPDREGYFGMKRFDNTYKPAYYAVKETIGKG